MLLNKDTTISEIANEISSNPNGYTDEAVILAKYFLSLPKLYKFGESSTEGDFAGTALDRRKGDSND